MNAQPEHLSPTSADARDAFERGRENARARMAHGLPPVGLMRSHRPAEPTRPPSTRPAHVEWRPVRVPSADPYGEATYEMWFHLAGTSTKVRDPDVSARECAVLRAHPERIDWPGIVARHPVLQVRT